MFMVHSLFKSLAFEETYLDPTISAIGNSLAVSTMYSGFRATAVSSAFESQFDWMPHRVNL